MPNRFTKYAQQPQAITPPSPMLPIQVQGGQLGNVGQGIHNRRDEATLPYDVRGAKADAAAKELKLQQDRIAAGLDPNTGQPAAQANGTNGPSGQAFLKTLSPADQRLVQAMADGRLIPPTGRAAASPYWQKLLGQTLQYDPSFDAIDYGARFNTRKDFTSGQSSRNIKALNTAIGHVSQLADQISGTASQGGYPFATTVNRAVNAYERGSGDPGITKFTQTAGAVSSELTQVFRGTGGAEADVQRYLSELDPNASLDQKKAAVGNILGLLKSRLDALNDQYTKGMGNASQGLDVLDPHSKQALGKYLPGFKAETKPPAGPGYVPPSTGPDAGMQSSQNGFSDTPDPQSAAFWEDAARKGTPYGTALRQWQSDARARGMQGVTPPPPEGYDKARAYIRQNPNVEYHPFNSIQRTPMGPIAQGWSDIVGSVPGVAIGHAVNALGANIPTALAGDQGSYYKAVTQAEHPRAAFAGDVAGTVAGAYQLNKALGPLLGNLPGRVGQFFTGANAAPELAPGLATARQALSSDMAFGGVSGAAGNPDHPVAGGLLGATAMGGGNLLGRYTLGPALQAAGDSSLGQFLANAIRSKSSGPFSPPAPLNPGQALVVKQAGTTLGDLTGRMQEAQSLGLPFSLADANPQLRALAGSAVRKSPDVRALAENTLRPRQLGQAERAIGALNDLAPVGDVSAIKADAVSRAQNASAGLYEKALGHPAPNDHALTEMMNTPAGQAAAREAYGIALNKGENPASLSFATDHLGNPIITAKPNWRTLQYMKMGLDSVVEKARDPTSGKLNLADPGIRAVNDLRGRFVGRLGELNPDYSAANKAYGNIIGQGTAAERGAASTGAKVTPEQTQIALSNTGSLPHFQQGYASTLADIVDRTRRVSDPYETIYGSPAQQQKLGIVFPQGASKFARVRGLESDMSKTAYETLGGSPTATRQEADQMFSNPLADTAVELGSMALTGGPSPRLLARGLMKLGDLKRLGLRGSQAKADQIGPYLLNTDPAINLTTLTDLISRNAQRQNYTNQARTLGGLVGGPLIFGATRR